MITVYKYPLRIEDVVSIEMPSQGRILHVDVVGDTEVFLWALVDTERPKALRKIRVAGTGHPIDERELTKPMRAAEPVHLLDFYYVAARHLGTVLTHGGSLVWHVFDMGESR